MTPKRRAAPVGNRRIKRESKIIECSVRHEKHSIEQEASRHKQAVKSDQLARRSRRAKRVADLVAEQRQKQPDNQHIDNHHDETVAHCLLNAVKPPRAEILSKDRRDCARKRKDRAESHRRQPADDRPARPPPRRRNVEISAVTHALPTGVASWVITAGRPMAK